MSLQRQILIWAVLLGLFVYTLYVLSGVLLPFLAGLTIGYLLDPLADKLERMGLNRLGATIVILAVALISLLVLLVLFVPILTHQFTSFLISLPDIAARLQALAVQEGNQLIERYGGDRLKAFGLSGSLTPATCRAPSEASSGRHRPISWRWRTSSGPAAARCSGSFPCW